MRATSKMRAVVVLLLLLVNSRAQADDSQSSKFLGCYQDSPGQPDFYISPGLAEKPGMKSDECIEYCREMDPYGDGLVRYAGIQFNSLCLCAPKLTNEAASGKCDEKTSDIIGANVLPTEVYDLKTERIEPVGLSCEIIDEKDGTETSGFVATVKCEAKPVSPGVTFTFNFDDGSPSTELVDQPTATHDYYKSGNYSVSLAAVKSDWYSVTYNSLVIYEKLSESKFGINCPIHALPGELITCDVNYSDGSGMELEVSLDGSETCKGTKKIHIPENPKIPLGLTVSGMPEDIQKTPVIPGEDKNTFIVMPSTMIPVEGLLISVRVYFAVPGNVKLMVLRPTSAVEMDVCQVDSCGSNTVMPSSKYTIHHEFSELFEAKERPQDITYTLLKAPHVFPGDVLAISADSSGVAGYRNVKKGEETDFSSESDSGKPLGVRHFIQAILSPMSMTVGVNEIFDISGNCTVSSTLSQTIDGKTEVSSPKSTMIIVAIPLEDISLRCQEIAMVGGDVSVTATVSNGSNCHAMWDFGDGTTEFISYFGFAMNGEKTHVYKSDGEYDVKLTMYNTYNSLQRTCKIIVEKKPVGTWTLTSDQPQLTPPGDVKFMVEYIGTDDLSGVTGVFVWADGNEDSKDITSRQETFYHTYKEAGYYSVFLHLQNPNLNLSTEVEILEKIQLEVIPTYQTNSEFKPGFGSASNTFYTNDRIKLTVGLHGTVEYYTVKLPNEMESTNPNTTTEVFTSFPKIGNYTILFTAFNRLQKSGVSKSVNLFIVEKQSLDVSIDDFGLRTRCNETKHFKVTPTLPSDVCISVDFGDGSVKQKFGSKAVCEMKFPEVITIDETENFPVDISHIFVQQNNYDVTVIAFTSSLIATKTITIRIYCGDCGPELIVWMQVNSTDITKPLVVVASKYSRIETEAITTFSMTKVENYTMAWTVWAVDETSGADKNETNLLDNYERSVNKSFLYLKPRFPKAYGLYKITYYYSLYVKNEKMPYICKPFTYLKVVKSDLTPVMVQNSPSYLQRGYGQTVLLDPRSLSIDPDDLDVHDFKISWICKQENEVYNFESEYNLQEVPSPADTHTVANDKGGCFGNGPGFLNIPSNSWLLNTKSFYKSEMKVKIEVKIEYGDRSTKTKLILDIVPKEIPVLNMVCGIKQLCHPLASGNVLISPSIRLTLIGECVDNCGKEDELDLRWDFPTRPPDKSEIVGKNSDMMAIAKTYIEQFDNFEIQLVAMNKAKETVAMMEMTFQVDKPPEKGFCKLTKNGTFALVDLYFVQCGDWIDPDGIGIHSFKVFSIDEKNFTNILISTSDEEFELILKPGKLELYAEVIDETGSVTNVKLGEVEVKVPFDSYAPVKKYMGDEYLRLVLSGNQFLIMDSLQAYYTLFPLYNDTLKTDDEKANHSEQINEYLDFLESMTVNTLDDLEYMANTVATIVGTGLSLDKGGRMRSMRFVQQLQKQLEDPEYETAVFKTPQNAKIFIGNAVSILGGIVASTGNILVNRQIPPSEFNHVDEIDYDTSVKDDPDVVVPKDLHKVHENAIIDDTAYNAKTELRQINGVISKFSNMVVRSFVPNEPPLLLDTPLSGVIMIIERVTGDKLEPKQLGGSEFSFPNVCNMKNDENDLCSYEQPIGISAVLWKGIFPSDGENTDKLANDSKTVDINLYSGRLKNVGKLEITNSTEDINITIPRTGENKLSEPDVIKPKMKWFEKMMYHQVKVTTVSSSVTVEFTPSELEPSFFIFLRYERKPILSNYDLLWHTSDLTYDANKMYSIFLTNDAIQGRTGIFYVGVVQLNGTASPPITINGSVAESMINNNFTTNYTMRVFTSSCVYYNPDSEAWVSDGCRVAAATNLQTDCKCNHLTNFATSFVVPPNPIDFSYVFANASFADNLTIYVTIIVTLSLFVIFLIWARYKDKKDLEKLGALPLPDNSLEDKYLYEIMVFTGSKKGSSTESKISFILTGDQNETEIRTFGNPPRKCFYTESTDVFVMAVARPLGQLQFLRLWHDNSGKGVMASWYLGYIIFRDVQTGEKFEFIADSWFALEKGDLQIDRVLPVADKDRLSEFNHLFTTTSNKKISDGHLWFSVFLRQPRSRFTRCQRVCSCVALLYLSMLVNAMWYGTIPDSPANGMKLGPFQFSPEQIVVGLMSNLIIFPPSFVIMYLFRKARPRKLRKSRIDEAMKIQREKYTNSVYDIGPESGGTQMEPIKYKRKKNFTLPWWCAIIAWILCIASIGLSIFFLWAYGITFGDTKTKKWITALVISFFSSILLTQPLKVLLVALFLSIVCKKVETDEDDADEDEEEPHLKFDEQWLQETGDPTKAKRIAYKQSQSVDAMERAKEQRQKEVKMWDVIREIIAYVMFIWLLSIVGYGTHDPNAFLMQQTLLNGFVNRKMEGDLSFLGIQTVDDYWKWTKGVMIQQLRVSRTYDGKPPFTMRGFLNDQVNRIMGNAILRQVRIQSGECPAPESMKNAISRCSGKYSSIFDEDQSDYDIGWTRFSKNTSKITKSYHDFPLAFRYNSSENLDGVLRVGTLDVYSGGGYVYEIMSRTKSVVDDFDKLQESKWIDQRTRAVFVEFSVYNAQVNLFGIVVLSAEFFPGGGIVTDYMIDAIQLLSYENGSGLFVLLCEIGFVIFILYFTIRELHRVCKQGSAYFRSIGNITEVALLIFSYSAIIVYIIRHIAVDKALETFNKTKGSKYVNLQHCKFLTDIFAASLALAVFIGMLKFIKLLRFNRRIAVLAQTLKRCTTDLGGFGLVFLIFFLAYGILFFLVFGTTQREYSSLFRSLSTLVSVSLNKFTFENYQISSPFLGPVIFFSFAFIMSIVLINLFLTIIIQSFEQVKHDLSHQSNEFEIVDFILNRFKNLLGLGGGTSPAMVMQMIKMDEDAPDDAASGFSNKVDKLLGYINNVYFDNRLDLSDKSIMKYRGNRPNFLRNMENEPHVFNSN